MVISAVVGTLVTMNIWAQTESRVIVDDSSARPRSLTEEVRARLVDKVTKAHSESFREFYAELHSMGIAEARAGIRTNISDSEFQATSARLQTFYENLPVVSSVAVSIPASSNKLAFDCVPSEDQPALKLGAGSAAGAAILDTPPAAPSEKEVDSQPPRQGASYYCPRGTVALKRSTVAEALAAQRLNVNGAAVPRLDRDAMRLSLNRTTQEPPQNPAVKPHRYAHAYARVPNYGVSARLNVWDPQVPKEDMSLSQVWVVGGDPDNGTLQTVEAGWQVMSFWDTPYATMFAFFTADNYAATGCYVLRCTAWPPGRQESFVFVGEKIVIARPLERHSILGGQQATVDVQWVRKASTGNWWLRIDKEWVGYFPKVIFEDGALASASDYIDFGGEMAGYKPSSDMGSGRHAAEGKTFAAFQNRLQYIGLDGQLWPAIVKAQASHPDCYSITLNSPVEPEADSGEYFYFGGPGSRLIPSTCN